jgi:HD domain-containing protein
MSSAVVCDLDWASDCATACLSPLGLRWLHVQSVAAKARQVGRMFDRNDYCDLVAAAYLHDIGYAPALARTGFHPLDGARYLRSLGYERLACLVAHHSEARFEAELRGLGDALAEFPRERSAVADALNFCDQLVGPAGESFSLKERASDIRARYGRDHVVWQAYVRALPYLSLAVGRTRQRLRRRGVSE